MKNLLMMIIGVAWPLALPGASEGLSGGPGPEFRAGQSAVGSSLVSVPQEQKAQGVKQALLNGVQSAIRELGHEGGFLTNLPVRIPMPHQLQTIERSLRALKQDQLADEFVTAMNHAAERADRKSTRLNSSHRTISYAVFCLK